MYIRVLNTCAKCQGLFPKTAWTLIIGLLTCVENMPDLRSFLGCLVEVCDQLWAMLNKT